MIKAVVFDFSGVIASPAYLKWVSNHVLNFSEKKKLYNEVFKKLDLGIYSKDMFEEFLSQETGVPKKEIWPKVLSGVLVHEGIIGIIIKLKKKYKIGLLSNYCHEALLEIIKQKRLEGYFDEILISSQCNLIKPQKEFFLRMLQRLNLKASEILFIDDSLENVKMARKIGMVSIHFKSFDQLRSCFVKLEII